MVHMLNEGNIATVPFRKLLSIQESNILLALSQIITAASII